MEAKKELCIYYGITGYVWESRACFPCVHTSDRTCAESEVLDKIQTKVLRVFLLVIHSHLYSFALYLYFFILTQPLTVSGKEDEGKPDRNHTPSLWFKKPIQKPQVWELSRLCPETATWLYVHEFGFCTAPLFDTFWRPYMTGLCNVYAMHTIYPHADTFLRISTLYKGLAYRTHW